MTNKILYTGLFPMWHYHFVSELNLIQTNLNSQKEIFLLECDEALSACECNKNHDLYHCLRCIGIRQTGISLLNGKINTLQIPKRNGMLKEAKRLLRKVNNLKDLKALRFDQFDVGNAVFSSLVDYAQNTEPDIKENKAHIFKLIADGLLLFSFIDDWLFHNKPEEVYIFNGRYATARALVRACEKNNILFYTHERTGNLNKLQLFPRGFPHDPRIYPKMAVDFWRKNKSDPEIVKQGIDFFEERPKGKLTGWYGMIGKQKKDTLPDGWEYDQRNVTIFATSESEFIAIDGLLDNLTFTPQLDIYSSFLNLAKKLCPEIIFYMRLHPHSATEKRAWWKSDRLLANDNLRIINPDSDVSSYSLLQFSEKIIGIGSTMCLEATYWGKPSILLAPTVYSGIDAVYEPRTYKEACDLLENTRLPAKPKENAIMFGAFQRCYGQMLEYSKTINYYTMDFKGTVLEARHEVHEWLGECEKRTSVTGFKRWLRDRRDRREFQRIWDACDGDFSRKDARTS